MKPVLFVKQGTFLIVARFLESPELEQKGE